MSPRRHSGFISQLKSDNIFDYDKPVIKITAKAKGGGVIINAEKTVPFEDGTYSLGDEITVVDETVKYGALLARIIKHLTAYAYDKHPVQETITLELEAEIKQR